MPPEYITYQASPHTNVTCEDCHMGRDRLPVMIGRKIGYSWQTGTAMLTNSYKYPIVAKNMLPARDACENCHKPEKFSTDTLIEIKRYAEDEANTLSSVFMVVKTGGGTQREGLGDGIHWHEDAGGTSNTSFCSNSACHGSSWTFAGFDAPKLRAVLEEQARLFSTPTPKAEEEPVSYGTGTETQITPTPATASSEPDTYATLQGLFKAKCGACHGSNAMKGLNVLDYNSLMKGSTSGAVILPGDPENSLLVKVQKEQHPGKFSTNELENFPIILQQSSALDVNLR